MNHGRMKKGRAYSIDATNRQLEARTLSPWLIVAFLGMGAWALWQLARFFWS